MRITEIWREFIQYKRVEEEVCKETIVKYEDCVKRFMGLEGDLEIEAISLEHFTDMRFQLKEQEISSARISSIIFCMRSLLRYCDERKSMQVLDPRKIKTPRKKKKRIVYMDNEEVGRFLDSIDLSRIYGIRMRALCEVLLDSGARISEILQLDRNSIRKGEKSHYALIVGKGDKERNIYFSPRAMYWIERYLDRRRDEHPALFVTHPQIYNPQFEPVRMKRDTLYRDFGRATENSGSSKKITQHILRHTFCSHLVQNGASIYHVKELAGHETIDTTVRFYAALDDKSIIETKANCLNYDVTSPSIAY